MLRACRRDSDAPPDARRAAPPSRDGILAWTKLRVTNGALEGMNNKVKAISHRAFGFRTPWTYMANIYHCCAELPLP